MTGQGRPIRFLALVALGWVGVRIVLLWSQTGSLPEAIRQAVPLASPAIPGAVAAPAQVPPVPAVRTTHIPPVVGARRPFPRAMASVIAADPERVQMALLALVQYGAPAAIGVAAESLPMAAQPDRLPSSPDRWSASAWLVARPGIGLGAAPGTSQIGGGQAGVRVAYMLLPKQRLAAFARVVTPLRGRGAEASLGLEWQPTRAPVRLVAEQRFGLDGVKSGPGIGVIAGFDGPVASGFRLESYGQAGTIRRNRTEPYADGAVRATHALAEAGGVRLALGGGVWGAAQRDAVRFDLGPSATLALPIGKRDVRLALDWRQRIAGDARPGSGLAFTLGSDF
ncbi:hypothetical protein [Sphingomonas sp. UNC305MFCol5.2]|uniref:hypothetical protein n=1 Tax=Sphingomonas sp. UNC305MFCol5.2 TaxID=1449076 RepID=UPI0004A7040F|nr:hypothetical protein [Sphingomonas sp. UNC305MFCol5.2]